MSTRVNYQKEKIFHFAALAFSTSLIMKLFFSKLSPEFNCQQTAQWLCKNSFGNYTSTFANFTGADILRLTRNDLIQICGVADGIRLLYSLHPKQVWFYIWFHSIQFPVREIQFEFVFFRAIVRLTLYVCTATSAVYHALYLNQMGKNEMSEKLSALLGIHQNQIQEIYLQGPNEIRILVTDEVVCNLKDKSMFSVQVLKGEITEISLCHL